MHHNLGRILSSRARVSGSLEALVEVERGRRFSYAELNARSNRAAHLLREQGVRAGDRVALLMGNGVEYLESYFGTAKLGAVTVPLNWRLVPDELEFILRDSGAGTLIFDAEFAATAEALSGRDLPVRHWLCVGDDRPGFASDYAALLEAAPELEPKLGAADEDLLFLMYTSGTTGRPKGVVHTHDSMLWSSLTVLTTAEIRRRDRYLQMLPLFHIGALTPSIATLHIGGTLVMLRRFDPDAVFEVIEREQVTTGLAVPAMLQFMWASGRRASADLSTLRSLLSGAAPVPVSLIRQYAEIGVEIQQVYGLTESGGPACLVGSEDALRKAGSTGPAFMHTEVRVVDEGGSDVGPGEVGEVIIRGRHVMKEYWNRPEATAETLRGGWLHSGDLATVDADGHVYIRDRAKDMIISGGENVYPAEVEDALASHPAVLEVAVIGMPSAKWGESAAAVVVRLPGQELEAAELLAYAREKLAAFKLPRVVEFVDALPRNPTGKILKRELRERFPGPAPE